MIAGATNHRRTTRSQRHGVLAALFAVALGCGGTSAPVATTSNDVDAKVDAVARIHGGAGPWAVAGYRMGEDALRALGLERGSFDLEIVHYTPREVQYSCIADGAAAATGASLGKLNLSLADAAPPETRTLYRRKSTGQTLAVHVTKAFAARFTDVPFDKLKEAGREVAQLPDADIFEVMP